MCIRVIILSDYFIKINYSFQRSLIEIVSHSQIKTAIDNLVTI